MGSFIDLAISRYQEDSVDVVRGREREISL